MGAQRRPALPSVSCCDCTQSRIPLLHRGVALLKPALTLSSTAPEQHQSPQLVRDRYALVSRHGSPGLGMQTLLQVQKPTTHATDPELRLGVPFAAIVDVNLHTKCMWGRTLQHDHESCVRCLACLRLSVSLGAACPINRTALP